MKNLIVIIMALSVAGELEAQEVALDSSYANGYYVERLAEFEGEVKHEASIVFIGNSITEAGNWKEILSDRDFANRGISGDNSFGVFARLDEALSLQPKKMFLMIGVNDLKRGTAIDLILRNHRRIAERVRDDAPDVELYIQSVLPVRDSMLSDFYSEITNEKIDSINNGLKEIAADMGFTYVELNKEVFADKDGMMYENFTTDGLHLSKEGYKAWAQLLVLKGYL